MKQSATLFLPVLLMLASCGTPAQYSQQRFLDGVYADPEELAAVELLTEEDFADMAAANIARERGRDTLVVIVDDPWNYPFYSHYRHYFTRNYPYYYGLGFGSLYWGSRFRSWHYDPWYGSYVYGYPYSWYDPWYSNYWYSGWMYDPWYYDYAYGYGYYGYYGPYGPYGYSYYPGYWGGSHWGGGSVGSRIYTPRSTTTVGGSRERRPGSGSNYRYGTAPSGSRSGSNSRSASVSRSQSTRSGSSSSSGMSSEQRRSAGYNPVRTVGGSSSRSSGSSSSYGGSSSSGNSTRSYSSGSGSSSGSSTRSYSSGSSSSSSTSRSYGGGGSRSSSGGGSSHSGNSSHSGGGGSRSGGGRR